MRVDLAEGFWGVEVRVVRCESWVKHGCE